MHINTHIDYVCFFMKIYIHVNPAIVNTSSVLAALCERGKTGLVCLVFLLVGSLCSYLDSVTVLFIKNIGS